MANLWDDVKKSLKDFSSSAMEKAEEFGKAASDKAEELTKVGKINWDIKQQKRDKEKLLQQLGQLVYTATTNNEMTGFGKKQEVIDLVNEIKTVEAEIKIKQDRIDAIHAEFGIPADDNIADAEVETVTPEDVAESEPESKSSDEGKDSQADKKKK